MIHILDLRSLPATQQILVYVFLLAYGRQLRHVRN